jgi:hypothetical protein
MDSYIHIWVNYNDLTVLPNPGIMVSKRNHPKMAQQFSLVKYNFPRLTRLYFCNHLFLLVVTPTLMYFTILEAVTRVLQGYSHRLQIDFM